VNAKEFLELVNNFDELDQEMYREVLKLTQKHPYFLPPYIMAAKYEKKASKGYSNDRLHDAALRSPDRKWLKTLMEGKLGDLIGLKQDPPSYQAQDEPSPPADNDSQVEDLSQQTIEHQEPQETSHSNEPENQPEGPQKSGGNREDILKKLEENLNRFKKKPSDDHPSISSKILSEEEDETGLDIIDSIKKKEKKEIKDPEQLRQKELINLFNKKSIKIAPVAEGVKQEDLSISSTRPKQEVVSESMAGLLVRQQKIEEAISMYQKLMLKFPDKKAYFADTIQKLEKKS
jgi:hypothetical protein